jgi:chitin disaccharide deacetylase
MGSSQASNEAAIRCFEDGVMRDVEVMAVGPWFPQAARLLRENSGLDVGLHVAITSEWDNGKWRPLTTAPSLVGRDGYFHPMIWPHPHYGKERALKEQPWKLDEIERELRAQIELAQREVPQLSHLSDHMGFQALGPDVAALVKRLAIEHGLDVDPDALGARYVGWDGQPETSAEKVASFLRVLEALGPGAWIFVDHPALDTPEMRATSHVGYETVAVDRQGVTDAWTSPAVREVVRRRGIELIGYKDLVKQ